MQLMESTACANPARTRRDASASPGSAAKAPFPNGVAPSGPEKFTFLRRKLVVYHLTTGDNNGISMGYIYIIIYIYWLVISTILKNISQWEGLSHILWKITNVPNHQPVYNIYIYMLSGPSIPFQTLLNTMCTSLYHHMLCIYIYTHVFAWDIQSAI